jgi:Tfp pilus assembly protein PilF
LKFLLVNPFLCLISFFILASPVFASNKVDDPFVKIEARSNKECTSCHKKAEHDWQQSDHSKSMAIANKQTVLANFNEIETSHFGQKAFFFLEDDTYQVTISYDEKSDTYPIKYTFGYFPLQQYLVETEKGRLQVLPFAWDSRDKEAGGQRWYHNYSHEEIRPEDRLHWRQPLQNWNGMCADCHSDGLVRNYNQEKNSFASQFDNINVGCLSCHGEMSEHVNSSKKRNVSKDITSSSHPTGQWLRNLGEKTAHWQGDKRDNSFMDGCFACHALRAPLTDGINADIPFLDQFTPQLPSTPNYYADGQIKEEVYVYGSFLQSKMFSAGVNCLDCHDKHTMKVKIEGNGLCLQCHAGEVYNVKEHLQHEENSAGAQCVNCHMPENRYMGVDDRRDHSFKVPHPELSQSFATPNACIKCHENKSNQWASESLINWHGKPQAISPTSLNLLQLNSGQAISLEQHLAIINDEKISVIKRASALQLLAYTTQTLPAKTLHPFITHNEPLLRLSAANVSTLISPIERSNLLSPLLNDPLKAIRVAAARSLISSVISPESQALFDQAFRELLTSSTLNSWRAEGRLNHALLEVEHNQLKAAEKTLKQAIAIEPYFPASYINLADLYRSQQRSMLVGSVLRKGMEKNPTSGDLPYSYGLHLIRQKQVNKAIPFLEKAMKLTPNNSHYAYTYVLAIDGTGQSAQALKTLKTVILNYTDKRQLKKLGLYLSQKLQSRDEYNWFYQLI